MLCLKKISLAVLLFSALMAEAKEKTVAVKYGGDENTDACSTLAMVTNLGEGKDEFLAVKAAPNLKATRTDKLLKNQSVWICEEQKDWYGIVYTQDEKKDCGVTKAIKDKKEYGGPCKSGWVSKKYVEPQAG